MNAATRYLAAYDEQLRTARTAAESALVRLGPLHLLTLGRGQGFVTYRDLNNVPLDRMTSLVEAALDHFQRDTTIELVDWKSCSHDRTPGLAAARVCCTSR